MYPKTTHYFDDEVELMLEECPNFYFSVKWRFKPKTVKKKFLFWEWEGPSREKWKKVWRYKYPEVSLKNEWNDPHSDSVWAAWRTYVGDKQSMDSFAQKVHRIKTYKDLDREFEIEKAYKQWEEDKKKYDKLLAQYNKRLKEGI